MKLVPRDTVLNFDDFVEQFFNTGQLSGESRSGFFTPRVDIHESKGNYQISAEMPGIAREDLEVTLENGVLTIEAEVHQKISEGEEEGGKVLRQERRYGKFTRSFNLGGDIKEEDIDATFKDGVLTLTVPKAEPKEPVSHRIQIH
ncbi:Hsp20/alpha crystallin family protein [Microbulbifer pacificus]|uniref:Hsp20/alpha crystallin family protein n=1 Tax=Microbulbifer pacificus TaxID=407164 RepID=A0AAU0MVD7_9GAMM|nr:Hsp20/alpha crystallin family protein [Microbulbifer pacificus]WOX04139.1 Hsp20/alpha crystallin family protein [Microbulbifer pacificus]